MIFGMKVSRLQSGLRVLGHCTGEVIPPDLDKEDDFPSIPVSLQRCDTEGNKTADNISFVMVGSSPKGFPLFCSP